MNIPFYPYTLPTSQPIFFHPSLSPLPHHHHSISFPTPVTAASSPSPPSTSSLSSTTTTLLSSPSPPPTRSSPSPPQSLSLWFISVFSLLTHTQAWPPRKRQTPPSVCRHHPHIWRRKSEERGNIHFGDKDHHHEKNYSLNSPLLSSPFTLAGTPASFFCCWKAGNRQMLAVPPVRNAHICVSSGKKRKCLAFHMGSKSPMFGGSNGSKLPVLGTGRLIWDSNR